MIRTILRVFKIFGIGLRLVWRLFWDPRVPKRLKILPAIAILYLLWPFDLIPDFIPGLGQLDDLAIMIILFGAFIILSPWPVVLEHALGTAGAQATYRGDPNVRRSPTVEARYRVESTD